MPKTNLEIIYEMEAALGRNQADLSEYFHEDFIWSANFGCGVKQGLDGFERGWYGPWREVFGNQVFKTEHYMEDGEWASCFGFCEATLEKEFMGIKATGQKIKITYMDFWRFKDGKIIENRVSVDFAAVMNQLGVDPFKGEGWEKYDV